MSKPFSNLKKNSIWNNPQKRPHGAAKVKGRLHFTNPMQYLRDHLEESELRVAVLAAKFGTPMQQLARAVYDRLNQAPAKSKSA